jgi:hypothetical protein
MTNYPPPCQYCGRARLQTGLCPHCEDIYCRLCNSFMSIINYADHCWSEHKAGPAVRSRGAYLFWWEIKRDWPVRCPDCNAILNNDGRCPEAVVARQQPGWRPTKQYPLQDEDIPWE